MAEIKKNTISFDKSTDVYIALDKFFNFYFTQRNAEAALSLISDTIFSIGTGEDEVAIGKEDFKKLLFDEIEKMPEPILYEIVEFSQKLRCESCWDCYCKFKMKVTIPDGIQVLYSMRLTAGVHLEQGKYLIDILHSSEASEYQKEGEYFPLNFISRSMDNMNKQTRQELYEIISQVMPGGIIGGYMQKGFPLYVANERLLSMAGYNSYDEFSDDIQGLVINSIHKDDQDIVNSLLETLAKTGDQYEIEYRMKKKDGSYFWVHDVGRRTVDSYGRDAIISVITDISNQIKAKQMLEKQASTDPLTGIYNRKIGMEKVETRLKECYNCMFFIIDIDNFKSVNDIYGHQYGDDVLRYVAQQMTKFFRKSTDIVFRLGGDEFVIFISDCDDINAIEKKIHIIINSYNHMMQTECPLAKSTLSVGGIYTSKACTVNEVYKLADEALYDIKKQQKGQLKLCIF